MAGKGEKSSSFIPAQRRQLGAVSGRRCLPWQLCRRCSDTRGAVVRTEPGTRAGLFRRGRLVQPRCLDDLRRSHGAGPRAGDGAARSPHPTARFGCSPPAAWSVGIRTGDSEEWTVYGPEYDQPPLWPGRLGFRAGGRNLDRGDALPGGMEGVRVRALGGCQAPSPTNLCSRPVEAGTVSAARDNRGQSNLPRAHGTDLAVLACPSRPGNPNQGPPVAERPFPGSSGSYASASWSRVRR